VTRYGPPSDSLFARTADQGTDARPFDTHHDGQTYEPAKDKSRLNAQTRRVYSAMADGCWRTLAEISTETGDPEASVSARLRDLRKSRFGGYCVERRRRGDGGLFEYRLRNEVSHG